MFVLLLAAEWLFPPAYAYPIRTLAALAAVLLFSRPVLSLRPRRALASALIGAAVCVVWIVPDAVVPGWRSHWLFTNPLFGRAPADGGGVPWTVVRAAGSALVVPIVEELFWRGWLMRWLTATPFWKAPLGAYSPGAFWITAALFASEHGPYWEVGLAAGIAYNWWMVRTRSLADCMLAHAVTNACLAAYVLLAGARQFWL